MTTLEIIEYYWYLNIPALIFSAALVLLHLITNKFRITNKSILFFDGILLLIITVCSPLDYLGHYYLFSAHMAEHVILLLVVPPILLSGTDGKYINKLLENPAVKKLYNIVFHPVLAWFAGVGIMWLWHIPIVFNLMNHSHLLHAYNMISLVLAGLIFMWPVFSPVGLKKLQPLQGAVYLFSACIGCTLLGMYMTFAPERLYSSYSYEVDPFLYNYIHLNWGITSAADQQIGGLIMWVPACVVYLLNILIIIIKWLQTAEVEKAAET